MGNFKKYWWKLLGILLVAFSVIMSFVVPLSAGIVNVAPAGVQSGTSTLLVQGYNTHFTNPSTQYWLCTNGNNFQVKPIANEVKGEEEVALTFAIPNVLPSNGLDLVINNTQDGTFSLPAAVFVKDAKVIPGISSPSKDEITEQKANHFTFPFKSILYETIRNLNLHVTMWFALLFCMFVSVIKSIRFLTTGEMKFDNHALQGVNTGLLFATLGLITGSIWARFTWGAWWVNDTKLNGAAISVLIYLAYLLLRSSINEEQKRARIAAVYNIFAFVMLIVFVQVLPRMTDSLHPGNGGNPAFSQYDLDNNLRMVFYPAVAGWILVSAWIIELRYRIFTISQTIHEHV